jgi:prepilin-type processing-associated H-X9-DG protein
MESAKRVECSNHLKQIGLGALTYANDFDGIFPECRNKTVQIAFNTREFEMLQAAGWADESKIAESFNCPSRNFKTNKSDLFGQWIIGYQYFGGIGQWRNLMGRFTSRSPISLQTSMPGWALAADTASKIDGAWGGGRATAYADMPSHKLKNSILPEGGNQLYADGSVSWANFYDMYYLHSWSGGATRIFYFYQKDLGGLVPDSRIVAQE